MLAKKVTIDKESTSQAWIEDSSTLIYASG